MNIDILAFDSLHHLGESATHPLIRLVVRLPSSLLVAPQGDSDPLRAKARVESYAGPGLPPRRFALKDSDPLWAETHVESYAPDTRPNAPSGAFNYRF